MSIVKNFLEQGYAKRIQRPNPNICTVERAAAVMDEWAREGHVTVFMAGTFDIPTPNHRLGLAEARLMAGSIACGIDYASLGEATPRETVTRVRKTAASDKVKLMVTLDTDAAVAGAKAFRNDKGGSVKPILSWETRAYNLASYTVPIGNGISHTMVDYIISHGPKACLQCRECLSIDNALMVPKLRPTLVVINGASHQTLDVVAGFKKSGLLPRTSVGITNERDHQYVDRLMGGRISGTAIVRRARSDLLREPGHPQYTLSSPKVRVTS